MCLLQMYCNYLLHSNVQESGNGGMLKDILKAKEVVAILDRFPENL